MPLAAHLGVCGHCRQSQDHDRYRESLYGLVSPDPELTVSTIILLREALLLLFGQSASGGGANPRTGMPVKSGFKMVHRCCDMR
jgi:hypothetical protein